MLIFEFVPHILQIAAWKFSSEIFGQKQTNERESNRKQMDVHPPSSFSQGLNFIKILRIFLGETERRRRMTTGAMGLEKLTPEVNFINILPAAFTYVSCAHSFFCAYI
jgi:hypothetical protein